jgi:hypothetical protein
MTSPHVDEGRSVARARATGFRVQLPAVRPFPSHRWDRRMAFEFLRHSRSGASPGSAVNGGRWHTFPVLRVQVSGRRRTG